MIIDDEFNEKGFKSVFHHCKSNKLHLSIRVCAIVCRWLNNFCCWFWVVVCILLSTNSIRLVQSNAQQRINIFRCNFSTALFSLSTYQPSTIDRMWFPFEFEFVYFRGNVWNETRIDRIICVWPHWLSISLSLIWCAFRFASAAVSLSHSFSLEILQNERKSAFSIRLSIFVRNKHMKTLNL